MSDLLNRIRKNVIPNLPIIGTVSMPAEDYKDLVAEVERLRAELKWAYGELIALGTLHHCPTTVKASRAKLERLEAAKAAGGE